MTKKLLRPHQKVIKIFALSLALFGAQAGHAQQAFVATGGDVSGAGGSASFSISQVIDTAPESGSGSVSQGVQQAFDEAVLPVTLVSFTAAVVNDRVQLRWETASELNNDFFTVERSADAVHFEEMTRVAAVGNSNISTKYNWTDDGALTGTSYYRLKQTDFDLTSTYSTMRAVTISSLAGTIVYPNPAVDLLTVRDAKNQKSDRSYQIFDLNGRMVMDKTVLNSQKMIDLSPLLPATYVIRLSNNSEVKEFKIVKN